MSNRGLWLEGGTTFPDKTSRALAVALAIGWFLLIVARNPPVSPPPFASRYECGSAPWEFLRLGELLDPGSLQFIVDAHCSNARYQPGGWIELRYGGMPVDIEVRPVPIADTTYFRIVSIGGVGMP